MSGEIDRHTSDCVTSLIEVQNEIINELRDEIERLRASAMAVVDRYDNPPITEYALDHQPTLGECIEDLRTALTEKEVGDE